MTSISEIEVLVMQDEQIEACCIGPEHNGWRSVQITMRPDAESCHRTFWFETHVTEESLSWVPAKLLADMFLKEIKISRTNQIKSERVKIK